MKYYPLLPILLCHLQVLNMTVTGESFFWRHSCAAQSFSRTVARPLSSYSTHADDDAKVEIWVISNETGYIQ